MNHRTTSTATSTAAGTAKPTSATSAADAAADEQLLLSLLNSTPVVDGVPLDLIDGPAAAQRWLQEHGRPATTGEGRAVLDLRPLLQDVVRGTRSPAELEPFLHGIRSTAHASDDGITWSLGLPPGRGTAALAVLAWDALRRSGPGRLRPCANDECRLFLIDHSKPNNARWCSMAVCGNRMKARRHYQKSRDAAQQ